MFLTFHTYESIPTTLRRQWCRMHLQCFPHVPEARAAWREKQAEAVLVLDVEAERVRAWSMYIKREEKFDLYTYTRTDLRGNGLGKAVAVEARAQSFLRWPLRPGASFYPHNPKAVGLYASLGYCDAKGDANGVVGPGKAVGSPSE